MPSAEGLLQALHDAQAREPGLLERLAGARDSVLRIEACLQRHVGQAGPDLQALRRFTTLLAETAARARRGAGAGARPRGRAYRARHAGRRARGAAQPRGRDARAAARLRVDRAERRAIRCPC